MVDPVLDSLNAELFNAVFDDITAVFPADLSRVYCRHPGKFSDIWYVCSLNAALRFSERFSVNHTVQKMKKFTSYETS